MAIVLVDVQLTADEPVSFTNDSKCETEPTSPAGNDNESKLSQADEVKAIIEDSDNLGDIGQTEEDVELGNSHVEIEAMEESAPVVVINNSEEPENAEFIDSEQAGQIVESNYDVEVDDTSGVEENSVDTAGVTNNEKSKIISIIKKCLGLN